jgi:hypothetical protein
MILFAAAVASAMLWPVSVFSVPGSRTYFGDIENHMPAPVLVCRLLVLNVFMFLGRF